MARSTHNAELFAQQWQESMRRSLQKEWDSFQQMLPDLLVEKEGVFVALCGGRVVDQDRDEIALATRVSRHFLDKFVLIQEVSKPGPADNRVAR